MVAPIVQPILPQHVPFEWVQPLKIEDEGAGSVIIADARIDGRVFKITHHVVGRKITQQEAEAKLAELTDRIILMKTRYFYGDVATVRFNGKDNKVQRIYADANRHRNEVFTNNFDENFDGQIIKATQKMEGYAVGSNKKAQAANRVERIKATKYLYELLKGKQRIPFQRNEQFTIQQKAQPPVPPPRTPQLQVVNVGPNRSAEDYEEQQVQLELAQEKFVQLDEQIKELEAENRLLRKHVANEHDQKQLADNKQQIRDLTRQIAELKEAQVKIVQERELFANEVHLRGKDLEVQHKEVNKAQRRIKELEAHYDFQKARIKASEKAYEELKARFQEQQGAFRETESLLKNLQDEVIPRTTAELDALKKERVASLQRFEEETQKLARQQEERIAQMGSLLNQVPAATALPIVQELPTIQQGLDNLRTGRNVELNHLLVKQDLEIIQALNQRLLERDRTIQRLQAQIVKLQDDMRKGVWGVLFNPG